MARAGCQLLADLTPLAVMWLFHAVAHLPEFWKLLRRADDAFRTDRPDALVLIDYPGFNWWMARVAKKYGVPVFYYGVPQMWAWAPWRIRKMRRLVDHAICKLPFEASWYRSRGCPATYVGHPYFDELSGQVLDREFLDRQRARPETLVTILPGSRTQEVTSNLETFFRTAEHLHEQAGSVRFAIAAYNERHAEWARGQLERWPIDAEVHVNRTAELIAAAHCCLACSGSVSLELLFREKPAVILYRIGAAAYGVQRMMRRVKYITLVNLLATENPFPRDLSTYDPDAPGAEPVPYPEYLTWRDVSSRMADHIARWIESPTAHAQCVEQLRSLKERFAQPGASERAAQLILDMLRVDRSQRRDAAA